MALPRTRSAITVAVLALSCAALAAVVRAEAPAGGPAEAYFASYLRMQQAATAGVKVTAKPTTYHEHVEVEHVCLQESRLKDCRFVGCPGLVDQKCDDAIRDGNTFCLGCVNEVSGTAQLSGCCDDHDYTTTSDAFGIGSLASVGSCDFSVDLLRSPLDGDYDPVQQAPGVYKIGGASGTCVLSEGVDKCGGPLCDKLYLNFQGSAYLAFASSEYGASNDASDDNTCNVLLSYLLSEFDGGLNGGRSLQEAEAAKAIAGSIFTVSAEDGAVKRELSRTVMQQLVEKAGLAKCPKRSPVAPTPSSGPAKGVAFIISGAFTTTSLESDTSGYSGGLLEYVPIFEVFTPGCEPAGVPADLHHVRPDAVRLMLTRGRRPE